MNGILRLVIIAAAAFAFSNRSIAEAKNGEIEDGKTKAVLSDLIEKTLNESGVPSISIALVRGDTIVWKAAFGYANVRTRTPATPETLYNAGSTFKAVTATALMQLVSPIMMELIPGSRPV